MPDHNAISQDDTPAPELPVTLDMPGKVADFLRASDLEPAERAAPAQGVPVRRGQGVPTVPAQRKARCEYENHVTGLGVPD
ncbi:hypothetical protein [Streptomyces afghaniensis]|uniref:hypothetical protein n=1 Tax=Streptomyces afghaniensis TaxID=66865 RepID=UPI0027810A9C|nr:hypothetical protein [Streptomyces afghaniensis]MDQ1022197.1 hypothetical protein [Streptomyces afghaniensis]